MIAILYVTTAASQARSVRSTSAVINELSKSNLGNVFVLETGKELYQIFSVVFLNWDFCTPFYFYFAPTYSIRIYLRDM